MKSLLIFFLFLSVCGCVVASPLDPLIPTSKPSEATTEYLGHLTPARPVNGLFHSLSDTKIEKALVPVRKMELEGLYFAAKGETEIIDAMGTRFSNGVWGGITGLLVAAGYLAPRPQEKAKVAEALQTKPPPTA